MADLKKKSLDYRLIFFTNFQKTFPSVLQVCLNPPDQCPPESAMPMV